MSKRTNENPCFDYPGHVKSFAMGAKWNKIANELKCIHNEDITVEYFEANKKLQHMKAVLNFENIVGENLMQVLYIQPSTIYDDFKCYTCRRSTYTNYYKYGFRCFECYKVCNLCYNMYCRKCSLYNDNWDDSKVCRRCVLIQSSIIREID